MKRLKRVNRPIGPEYMTDKDRIQAYIESKKIPSYLIAINDGRIYRDANWSTILKNLRRDTKELIDEGRRIVAHFQRMEREYGDWEDRLNALDVALSHVEKETGIPVQAVFDEITIPQHTNEPKPKANLLGSIFDDVAPKKKPEPTPTIATMSLAALLGPS